jgi:DNA-directed RNA polymerase specialized sigma24 family protein
VAALTDDALRDLIRTRPNEGWRAFIDQYTPMLVGLIRRAGVDDRDDVMDVYVMICERLSANGFERLKSQDAARGSIGGWLAVLARHTAVDWIRSKKGRRRLFQSIQQLEETDQRIFEMYYWDERTPPEIAEIARLKLTRVFDALARIHQALNERHRAELMASMARSKAPVAIDETDAADRVADNRIDPETSARIAQLNQRFESALRRLPAEEAAIVRLKYVEALPSSDVQRALGLARLTAERLTEILGRLRGALESEGIDGRDVALAGGISIDGGAA